jgi:hypothetical protein
VNIEHHRHDGAETASSECFRDRSIGLRPCGQEPWACRPQRRAVVVMSGLDALHPDMKAQTTAGPQLDDLTVNGGELLTNVASLRFPLS